MCRMQVSNTLALQPTSAHAAMNSRSFGLCLQLRAQAATLMTSWPQPCRLQDRSRRQAGTQASALPLTFNPASMQAS